MRKKPTPGMAKFRLIAGILAGLSTAVRAVVQYREDTAPAGTLLHREG